MELPSTIEKITINVEHCVWRICMLSYKLLYSGASFYDVQLIRRVHVVFPWDGERYRTRAATYLKVLWSLMFIRLLRNSIKLFSPERQIFKGPLLVPCSLINRDLWRFIAYRMDLRHERKHQLSWKGKKFTADVLYYTLKYLHRVVSCGTTFRPLDVATYQSPSSTPHLSPKYVWFVRFNVSSLQRKYFN